MQNMLELSKWLDISTSIKQIVLSKLILSLLMVLIDFLIVLYSGGRNQEPQEKGILQESGPQASVGM